MSSEIIYCQRCASKLAHKEIEDRIRPYCPNCGTIVYIDPKLAVVALVHIDGKLVLVKRGIEPALGSWSFPAGYVDRGEVVEEAAVREVREETGLHVDLDGAIGLYSKTGNQMVLAVYSASVVGGKLGAGPEVQDVGLFSPGELPPLPFPHDYQILEDWQSQYGEYGQ